MRMSVDWKREWEIGIPPVDKDHKVLVNLINQVYQCVGDNEEKFVLSSVLQSLAEYTVYHFAREERLQEVAGYADLSAHRERHHQLVEQVQAIGRQYEADVSSVKAVEVLNFLKNWLVDHILKHDMGYRAACLHNQTAIAACEAIKFGDESQVVPASSAVAPPKKATAIDWTALSVVVVEDNKNFQMIVQTILRSMGVRDIMIVSSGREGLELLSSRAPGLVLCDWRMEGMDGISFVRSLREAGNFCKVVIMSGYATKESEEQALLAGANAFLEKPITARSVMDVAAKVLLGA